MRVAAKYTNGMWYILKNIKHIGLPDLHICYHKVDQYGLETRHYHFKLKRFMNDEAKAFYEQIEVRPEDIYYCKKRPSES